MAAHGTTIIAGIKRIADHTVYCFFRVVAPARPRKTAVLFGVVAVVLSLAGVEARAQSQTNATTAAPASVTEGSAATITVTLDNQLSVAGTLSWTLTPNQNPLPGKAATGPLDFRATSGTVTVPSDVMEITFDVTPMNDDRIEYTEVADITITSASFNNQSSATFDVTDNEADTLTVGFVENRGEYLTRESRTAIEVLLEITPTDPTKAIILDRPVTLLTNTNTGVSGLNARAGTDFTAFTREISFAASRTAITNTAPREGTIDVVLLEPTESVSFQVVLTESDAAVILQRSVFTVFAAPVPTASLAANADDGLNAAESADPPDVASLDLTIEAPEGYRASIDFTIVGATATTVLTGDNLNQNDVSISIRDVVINPIEIDSETGGTSGTIRTGNSSLTIVFTPLLDSDNVNEEFTFTINRITFTQRFGAGMVEVIGADIASGDIAGNGPSITITDAAPPGGICGRTPAVQTAILGRITGVDQCQDVTATHLENIDGTLDLSDMDIFSLEATDFAGLSSLQTLRLSGNPRLTRLHSGQFGGLARLESLQLNGNGFSRLDENQFDGLSALIFLDLSNNQLGELHENLFNGLSNLSSLILHDNQLRALDSGLFNGLSRLNLLVLTNNDFTRRRAGISGGLPAGIFDDVLDTLVFSTFGGLRVDDNVRNAHFVCGRSRADPGNGDNRPVVSNAIVAAINTVSDCLRVSTAQLDGISRLTVRNLNSGIRSNDFDDLSSIENLQLFGRFSSLPSGAFTSVLDTLTTLNLPRRFRADAFIDPITVDVAAGATQTVTARLTQSLPHPLRLNITAGGVLNNAGHITVPDTVTIPAGETEAAFDITLDPAADRSGIITLSDPALIYNPAPGEPASANSAPDVVNALAVVDAEQDLALVRALSAAASASLTADADYTATESVDNDNTASATLTLFNPPPDEYANVTFNLDGSAAAIDTPVFDYTLAITHAGVAVTRPSGDPFNAFGGDRIFRIPANTGTVHFVITPRADGNVTEENESIIIEVTRIRFADDTIIDRFDRARATLLITEGTGICRRTRVVEDAILEKINEMEEPDILCDAVTKEHLNAVTGRLNLSRSELASRGEGRLTALRTGDFSGLTGIDDLDLTENNLTALPSGVFTGLDSLEHLRLRGNELTSLNREVFADLTNLQTLLMSENELTSLPRGVFDGLNNLRALHLYGNNMLVGSQRVPSFIPRSATSSSGGVPAGVGGVPAGVFDDVLDTLITVGDASSGNLRVDDGVRAAHFVCGRTPAVRDAIVDAIPEVTDCMRITTTQLERITGELNFRGGGLTALQRGDFAGLPNLGALILAGNRLTTLHESLFNSLPSLRTLDMSDNDLVTPHRDLFGRLSSLRTLNLDGNDDLTRLSLGTLNSLLDTLTSLMLPDAVMGVFAFAATPETNINPGDAINLTVDLDKPVSVAMRLPYTAAYEDGATDAQFTGENGALVFPGDNRSQSFTVGALVDVPVTGSAITITLGTPELGTLDGGNFQPFSRPGTAGQQAAVLSEIIVEGNDSIRRLTTPPYPDIITAFAKEPEDGELPDLEDGELPDLIEGNAVLYRVTLNRPALIDTNITYTITSDNDQLTVDDFTGATPPRLVDGVITGTVTVAEGRSFGLISLWARPLDGLGVPEDSVASVEGSEDFTINLVAPDGFTIADGVEPISDTIIDGDGATRIGSVEAVFNPVMEGTDLLIVVTLENESGNVAAAAAGTLLPYTITGDVDAADFTGDDNADGDGIILTGRAFVPFRGTQAAVSIRAIQDDNDFSIVGENMVITFRDSSEPSPGDFYHVAANIDDDSANRAEVNIQERPPEGLVSITIADDDLNEGDEGGAEASMTVVMNRPTLTGATITYDVGGTPGADDGAESGDYSTPPTATIPAGMADATFTVPLNDDNRVENTESGRITITEIRWRSGETINGITLPGGSIDLTVDVNDILPGVQLQKPLSSFPSGELKPCSLLAADATAEAVAERCLSPFADFTITDNDGLTITVSAIDQAVEVAENVSDGNVDIVLTAVPNVNPVDSTFILDRVVKVWVATANGDNVDGNLNATGGATDTTPGADYVSLANDAAVTFAINPTAQETDTATISIPIIEDTAFEFPEVFTVSPVAAGEPNGGIDEDATATVTINDDERSSISITPTNGTETAPGETADNGSFAIYFPDTPVAVATVTYEMRSTNGSVRDTSYTLAGGNGVANLDSTPGELTFTIAADVNNTNRAILNVVPINDDDIYDENITLNITGVVFAGAPETASITPETVGITEDDLTASLTIDDDDTLVISLPAEATVTEEEEEPDGGGGVIPDVVRLIVSGGTVDATRDSTLPTVNIASSLTSPNPSATSVPPTADFEEISQTITITSEIANAGEVNVNVVVVNENVVENDETFTLTLSDPTRPAGTLVALGTQRTSTVTIRDNDTTTVSISPTADSESEETGEGDDNQVTYTISADADLERDVNVNVSINDGTAIRVPDNDYTATVNSTDSTDYTGIAIPINLNAAEANRQVVITVIDDVIDEDDETFTISVAGVVGQPVSGPLPTATQTILDDDNGPTGITALTVANAPEENAETTATITLNNPVPPGRMVTYNLAGSGAAPAEDGADYPGGTQTVDLTLSQGVGVADNTYTFPVAINNDDITEDNEGVSLTVDSITWTAPDGETATFTVTEDRSAAFVINDDDTVTIGLSGLSSGGYTFAENAATPQVMVQVTGVVEAIGLQAFLISTDVSATSDAPADYTALVSSEPVSIPAGTYANTPIAVDLAIVDDSVVENTERFTLALTAPHAQVNVTGTAAAHVDITDNDRADVVIDLTEITVREADTQQARTVEFTVRTATVLERDVSVTVSIADVTTTRGDDYTARVNGIGYTGTAIPVVFNASNRSFPVTVAVLDDSVDEADTEELTISVAASNAQQPTSPAFPDTLATATLNIMDNDESAVRIMARNGTDPEGNAAVTPGTFVITVPGAPSAAATVTYRTSSTNNSVRNTNYTLSAEAGSNIPSANLTNTTFTITNASMPSTLTVSSSDADIYDEIINLTIRDVSFGAGHAANITDAAENPSPLIINDLDKLTISMADSTAIITEATDNTDQITLNLTSNTLTAGRGNASVMLTPTASGTVQANPAADLTGTSREARTITITHVHTTAGSLAVPIAVNNDNSVESSEELTLTLSEASGPTGANVMPDTSASATTVTIEDNDNVVASVSANSPVAESADPTATVTLEANVNASATFTSGAFILERAVDVTFTTGGGSATRGTAINTPPGADYIAPAETISFAADPDPANPVRPRTETAIIDIIDDNIVEVDETFNVTVSPAGSNPQAEVTITDNDGASTISAVNASNVTEGEDIVVSITLDDSLPLGDVTVEYTINTDTVEAADFGSLTGSVTDAGVDDNGNGVVDSGDTDGFFNVFTFNVPTIDDNRIEGAEAGTLTIDSITHASRQASITSSVSDGFTINDNDSLTVSAPSTANVAENVPGGNVNIVLTAEPNITANPASTEFFLDRAVKVQVSTADRSDVDFHPNSNATAGIDYAVRGVEVEFAANPAAQTIATDRPTANFNVPIIDDAADPIVESDEIFNVNLAPVSGEPASIGTPATTAVTITDNEDSDITINATSGTETAPGETADNGTFAISFPDSPDATATVTYEIASTNSVLGTNYTLSGDNVDGFDTNALSGSFTIADDTTGTLNIIPANDDDIYDENIQLNISGVTFADSSPSTAIGAKNASLSIIDNDTLTVSLSAPTFVESTEGGNVRLSVSGGTVDATRGLPSVDITSTPGSATSDAPVDFTAIASTGVEITPAIITAGGMDITVSVENDLIVENDEMFTLEVVAGTVPTGAHVNLSASATVTIEDDDDAIFTIGTATPRANENIGNVVFTISTATTLERSVGVIVSVGGGAGDTATGGPATDRTRDYTEVADTPLTFTSAPGEDSHTITVAINDDTIDELDEETLTISVAADTDQPADPASEELTILDNDDGPTGITSLSVKDVTEGITEADTATIVLNNPIPTGSTMQVTYNLAGSGAAPAEDGADYPGGTQTVDLTLSQGEGIAANTYTFPVATSTDNLIEGNEDARLEVDAISWESIDTTSSFTAPDAVGSRDTFTIQDDDNLSVALAAARLSVGEETGTGAILSVGGGDLVAVADVVVTTAVSSTVSAEATDFTTVGTINITIPIDDYSMPKTIDVNLNINDDDIVENEETFDLTLTENPDNPRVVLDGLNGRTTATVTIEDDDDAIFTITPPTPEVMENAGDVEFTIRTGTALERDVSVTVSIADVTTTRGDDYTARVNSIGYTGTAIPVVFNASNRSFPVTVAVLEDSVDEADTEELTISVAASNAQQPTSPAFPDTLATATLNIMDNDESAVRIMARNGTDPEGNAAVTPGTFVITVPGAPSAAATVTYETSSTNNSVRDTNYTLIAEAGSNIPSASLTNTTFTITDASMPSTLTVSSSDADIYDEIINLTIRDVSFGAGHAANITDAAENPSPLIINDLDKLTISMADSTAIITEATDNTDQITLNLTSNTLTAGRGDASVMLTPTASGTVQANPAADLTGDSQTVRTITITPAHTTAGSRTVPIDVNGDDFVEAAEEFTLTLSDAAGPEGNVEVGAQTTTTVTITDNDEAEVTVTGTGTDVTMGNTVVSGTDITVQEDMGPLTINVEVSNAANLRRNIDVTLATADGSANAGTHYTNTNEPLTFVAGGATTQTFSVPITNDTNINADRTFTITLTSSDPVMLPGPYTVTIVNEDMPTIGFGTPDVMSTSIMTPENIVGGELEVQISVAAGDVFLNPVTVLVQSADGTALNVADEEGDYDTVSQTLTFNSNAQTHTQTITIEINDDTFDEVNETFTLALSLISGAANIGPDATVTIEDDNNVTIGFMDTDISISEGDTMNVTVKVQPGTTLDRRVAVKVFTRDGTATAGEDYTAIDAINIEKPIFTADDTSHTFTIAIPTDTVVENDETFTLHLTSVDPADTDIVFNPAMATVTIGDASGPGTLTVGFDQAAYRTGEDAGSVELTATLRGSGTLARDVIVKLSSGDGSATADSATVPGSHNGSAPGDGSAPVPGDGSAPVDGTVPDDGSAPGDYIAIFESPAPQLTFTALNQSQSFEVGIINDEEDEGESEWFVAMLAKDDADTFLTVTEPTAIITITDDDTQATGVESVTAVPDSIPEDGGVTTITVILNGRALSRKITLHYAIHPFEGDEITHQDFSSHEALMNHEITIPQGSDRVSFTITTAADSDVETPDQGEESFFVTVTEDDDLATPPSGLSFTSGNESSNHVTITELDVEVVAAELEALSLIVAMEGEVRLTHQLIRQRIESPFFRQPKEASPTTKLTLPDNPQNMDDMIDGLGLNATGISDSGWHFGMYARGQRSNFNGTPTVNGNTISYDGNATGIGGGMEWSNDTGLFGIAANYVITDLALTAADANISRYREKVILTAPYFSVKHGRVAKYWGMIAAGVGDAQATLDNSTTDSANVQVGFVAGGADITLINQGDEEVVFGLSGLGVRKEVEEFNFGAARTIPKTKVDNIQARSDLTWFRNIVVGDELLRPYIGIASLHDFGDVISDDRHGLDARAGITYAKGELQVGMEVTSEFLRKDQEQWAFSGGISWDARLNGRGLRLGLSTAHLAPIGGGIAATGGSNGVDRSWEVTLEGEYGLSVPLMHRNGLLTPFAKVTERKNERELSGGMRFLIGNGVGVDFETLQRDYQDEEDFSEHRVGLRGRWKF